MNALHASHVSLLLLAAALAGCTSVNPKTSTSFPTAVAAARSQTEATFATVQEITRASAIEAALDENKLSEDVIQIVPSPKVAEGWNRVLDGIDRYAQHLASLAAGGEQAKVDVAIGDLAKEFNSTAALHASAVGPQLSSVVGAFAHAVITARTQKQVTTIAASVDPEIRAVFTAFADRIGADQTKELRGSVDRNWSQRIGVLEQEFRDAKSGSRDQRRQIVIAYMDALAQRAACDAQLASLRHAYLALADIHTSIAAGNEANARSGVAFLVAELQHARELQAQYAKVLKP